MIAVPPWITENLDRIVRILVILAVSLPLVPLAEKTGVRFAARRLSPQGAMLWSKAIRYGLSLLVLMLVLSEMGFNLTAILGAAGIAGVALGFASQTSLSNLISGFFLVAEKPFQVGDALQVGDTLGLVHSIDLLSVKLRTFDNRLVRIPNETLIKSTFTNITRFPIRRFDINLGVAYKEDVEHVTRVLEEIADRNPFALDEPAPIILFKGFGDSALEFLLGVWFEKTDMLALRNSIQKEIKRRFDEEGIEIPFPHRTLYTGSVTDPFPIRIVPGDPAASPTGETAPPAAPGRSES